MLDHLTRALVWADSHGLTVPVILGALTVVARLVWAGLRPTVARRWPTAVPVIESAAARVAALLPDVLAAILRRRPAAPSGRSGEAGRASPAALALAAFVGLLAVTACPRVTRDPTVPAPPAGCVAGQTICHEGAPWRCGPGGVWSQADRRCDRIGGVCCLTPSAVAPRSVHACTTHDRCEAPDAHP